MVYEEWVRHYGAQWRNKFGVEMVVDANGNGVDLVRTPIKLKRAILAGKYGAEGKQLLVEVVKNPPDRE